MLRARGAVGLAGVLLLAGCAEADDAASVEADEIVVGMPFSFRPRLAAETTACPGCADADGDGLSDAWEDAVLARYVPVLELDENEKGLRDPAFRLGIAGRVVPRPDAPSRIVVFFAFAFSEDYGSCSVSEHHGDIERAVIELARVPGTAGGVDLVRAFTAAHEGTITDKSHVSEGDDLDELELAPGRSPPRWLVYSSRNKHATYVSKAACERSIIPCVRDNCGAAGAPDPDALRRLLPVLNAGEPARPRASDWSAIGYRGVDAWSEAPFCGGSTEPGCDGPTRFSLVRDPFTKQDL